MLLLLVVVMICWLFVWLFRCSRCLLFVACPLGVLFVSGVVVVVASVDIIVVLVVAIVIDVVVVVVVVVIVVINGCQHCRCL